MKISVDTIKNVAGLARLILTKEEEEKMASEMESILKYVDKLNELDTEGIKPMEHVIPVKNVFREDEIDTSYNREDILKNAPTKENGCFTVPKVV